MHAMYGKGNFTMINNTFAKKGDPIFDIPTLMNNARNLAFQTHGSVFVINTESTFISHRNTFTMVS